MNHDIIIACTTCSTEQTHTRGSYKISGSTTWCGSCNGPQFFKRVIE